jgi:archaellum component FlaG (FlaF/FlaG flagellin family)
MPANAASHTIFFIGALVISSILATVFIGVSLQLKDGIEARSDALNKELRTGIEIINDARAVPYDANNSTLILYIKNTGSTTIPVSSVLLEINGTVYGYTSGSAGGTTFNETYIISPTNTTEWLPETTLVVKIKLLAPLVSGSMCMVKVTACYGASDTFAFRVR